MEVVHSIALDFSRRTMPITIYVKQFDKDTRKIEITPLRNGAPFPFESGVTARLQMTKPDGTTVINNALIASDKITVTLSGQCLTAFGTAIAEIGLYKSSTLLTSQTFFIEIQKAAYDEDAPESSDEYGALIDALSSSETATAQATSAAASANNAASSANTAAEQAQNATTDATEVITVINEIAENWQSLLDGKANIKYTTLVEGVATDQIPFINNATDNDVIYRVLKNKMNYVEGYMLFLGNVKYSTTVGRVQSVAQIFFTKEGKLLYRTGTSTKQADGTYLVEWASDEFTEIALDSIEQTGNKVRAISDDSPSDDKYPTEKAVRDYVAEKVSDPEYIAYDQRNKNVVEFLDVYDDYADCSSDPNSSYLTSLLDDTTRYSDLTTDNEEYSRPLGVNVDLPSAGTLMIRDGKKTMSYAVSAGTQKVYNITPGNVGAYYLGDSSGNLIDYKLLKPLRTDPHPLRMIYCKVTRNIRDIGGWACDGGTIKFGKLFRGAIPFKNPANISEDIDANDVDYDKKVLHDLLGIRFELDLQTGRADQAAVVPGGSVIGDDVDYIAILGTYYALQDFLSENGKYTYSKTDTPLDIAPQYLRMFRCIIDCAVNNVPLYFHCLEGADRTGTLAMMIEAILGVSPSDIDKDYELTTFQTGNKDNHTNWRRRNERSSSGNRGWRVLMFGNESLSPALPGIYNYPGVTGDNLRDRVVSWLLMMSDLFPAYAITIDDIRQFRASMIESSPDNIYTKSEIDSMIGSVGTALDTLNENLSEV